MPCNACHRQSTHKRGHLSSAPAASLAEYAPSIRGGHELDAVAQRVVSLWCPVVAWCSPLLLRWQELVIAPIAGLVRLPPCATGPCDCRVVGRVRSIAGIVR